MWSAIFPGQGSQIVGMGRFFYDEFKVARETFEEASDVLGRDLKKLCFDGPENELQQTMNTQPALLLVSTVAYRVVQAELAIEVSYGAGHSVGEYAALVCSEALSFADALRAVHSRGHAMQAAVPLGEGAMLAVLGLSDAQVEKLCSWVQTTSGFAPLEPANFNCPGQVVVSGSSQAINWLKANMPSQLFQPETPRMKFIPLAVSAPFHCSMMQPAEQIMREVLGKITFRSPRWPVIQNVTAQPEIDPEVIRGNLVKQVCGAVRWSECMSELNRQGALRSIEFGAGKVLSGLAKKIDSNSLPPFNLNSLEDIKKLELAMKAAPLTDAEEAAFQRSSLG